MIKYNLSTFSLLLLYLGSYFYLLNSFWVYFCVWCEEEVQLFFYMKISSYISTVCWKKPIHFFTELSWDICQKLSDHICEEFLKIDFQFSYSTVITPLCSPYLYIAPPPYLSPLVITSFFSISVSLTLFCSI